MNTSTKNQKFKIGIFTFGNERSQHATGESFYNCKILKMTKCFIYIKSLSQYDWQDKVRCKILKDEEGFYIKPGRAFTGLFKTFKVYAYKMKEIKKEEEETKEEIIISVFTTQNETINELLRVIKMNDKYEDFEADTLYKYILELEKLKEERVKFRDDFLNKCVEARTDMTRAKRVKEILVEQINKLKEENEKLKINY
tara:strand:- start:33 stop:626 length:594 start_codon:yes stop_codon:yes gene_type:complete